MCLWTNSWVLTAHCCCSRQVGSPNYYSISCIFSIKCCSTINWFVFRNSNCMCSDLTYFGQVTGSDNVSLLTVPDALSGLRSLLNIPECFQCHAFRQLLWLPFSMAVFFFTWCCCDLVMFSSPWEIHRAVEYFFSFFVCLGTGIWFFLLFFLHLWFTSFLLPCLSNFTYIQKAVLFCYPAQDSKVKIKATWDIQIMFLPLYLLSQGLHSNVHI